LVKEEARTIDRSVMDMLAQPGIFSKYLLKFSVIVDVLRIVTRFFSRGNSHSNRAWARQEHGQPGLEQFAVLEAREHVYHDHQTFGIESEEIVVLGSLGICG
jgi:hypothetical protein